MPTPLDNLLKEGRHFGNIHKVLAIKNEDDLARYIDVLYLAPEREVGSQEGVLDLHADSLPVPPQIGVRSGRLQAVGMGAARRRLERGGQGRLPRLPCRPLRAGAARMARHRKSGPGEAARGGRSSYPPAGRVVGTPNAIQRRTKTGTLPMSASLSGDDYDMLAALAQACIRLSQYPEFSGQWQAAARLQAFWNICRQELTQIDRMLEATVPVRQCASEMRRAGLLDALANDKRAMVARPGGS
jgi:hypothetical protein